MKHFSIDTFLDGRVTQYVGDVLKVLRSLPDDHFDCVVTSPPYWGLRDYGTGRWEGGDPDCEHRSLTMKDGRNEKRPKLAGSAATNSAQNILAHHTGCGKCGAVKIDEQIGLERTLGDHLAVMVEVFREVRRVLKPSGTLWLNYGDCYATAPNGRSAADTKAAGGDDRTFRDKPFSTIGAIYEPNKTPRGKFKSGDRQSRHESAGRVVGDAQYDPAGGSKGGGKRGKNKGNGDQGQALPQGRVVSGGFLKSKDLCMIPNRLAIALQDDGWWVRSEIIWHKLNPMPESIKDRPTSAHEKIWLMTKAEQYFYDANAIAETANYGASGRSSATKDQLDPDRKRNGLDGNSASFRAITETRNSRNVWTLATSPFPEAHFATFPPELAERCIKAGSPAAGEVLDIFGGAGTTALVAATLGRRCTLIELNPEYAILARSRIESAFMGDDEGRRHMIKKLGKLEDAGPLFAALG